MYTFLGGSRTLAMLVIIVGVQTSCAVHYTRAKRNELVTTEKDVEIAHRLDTNEILATDSSGIVCASISTNLSAYAGAKGALNKMEREGTYRESFTYKRASPAQFAGVHCGFYYRWAEGTNAVLGDRVGERPSHLFGRTSLTEVGFHMEGSEQILDSVEDLHVTARLRVGGGKAYQESGTFLVEGTRILFPLDVGLLYAPAFLFGAGVKSTVGYDVLNLVVDAGSASQKFNYGGSGFYRANVGKVTFGLEGGWRHESVASTDPGTWIEADDFFGTLWANYDFK